LLCIKLPALTEEFNVWEMLAGVGMFLYGMFLLEESIRLLSGRTFKRLIHKYTDGRIKSILAGTSATAILQSSSAVTLMVLAFAGAGVLKMPNAIGVILGSNIGTTLTSWIVAVFGFKIEIESVSLPVIAIGGFGLIFFRASSRAVNVSRFLVGFGLLFMGLGYMKTNMQLFAADFDITDIPTNIIIYLLAGFLLTAIVQSSSAAMAIILSSLNSDIITFQLATAMVVGSNLGTTVTVLLGSVGGSQIKKRVAFSHFFFNLFTVIIALSILPALIYFVNIILGFANEPLLGLAMFHTIFNVLGILIIFPFITLLSKLLFRIFPEEDTALSRYLIPHATEVAEAGLEATEKEVSRLINSVIFHNGRIAGSILPLQPESLISPDKKHPLPLIYEQIKLLQTEIFSFVARLQKTELKEVESHRLYSLLDAARIAVQSAKSIKDVQSDLHDIQASESGSIIVIEKEINEMIMEFLLSMHKDLEGKDTKELQQFYQAWDKKLLKQDRQMLSRLSEIAAEKDIKVKEITSVISVNRALFYSRKHLLTALYNLTQEHELIEPVNQKM
jgi:phosphate:Na+ symporter